MSSDQQTKGSWQASAGSWDPPDQPPGEGWWQANDGTWYPPDVPRDGWWIAANGRWYPPESSPGLGWRRGSDGQWYVAQRTSGSDAAARRPRVWLWVVGAVAVVIGAVGAFSLLVAFDEAVLTHDLLDADFDSGPYPFVVDENDEYTLDVVDGTYQISAKSGSPRVPAISHAWFTRTAWYVEAAVTIVDVPDPVGGVGIGCVNASAETPFDGGFMFIVGDGQGLLVDVAAGEGVDDAEPMVVRAGQRIGIECGSEVATVDGAVRASIDGEVVMERSNGSPDGFNRLVLIFYPGHEGDSARFDDAIAEVP